MKKMKSAFAIIFVLCMMSLTTAPALADDTFYLWSYSDASGWGDKDYYHYEWTGTYYLGHLHYEWMVQVVPSKDTTYSYYAVHIIETLTPSYAGPNSRHLWLGSALIEKAITTLDVTSNKQMIADSLPPRTSGTVTYGTGVSLGYTSTFTATTSYSQPDTQIEPYTDWSWGGYTQWTCYITWLARGCQNRFHFTVLVRAYKGQPLDATVFLYTNWLAHYWEYIGFTDSFTIYLGVTGNPGPGPWI